MKKNYIMGAILICISIVVAYVIFLTITQNPQQITTPNNTTIPEAPIVPKTTTLYTNNIYGFELTLPIAWSGYSTTEVQKDTKQGTYFEVDIKHPQSTKENPRMEIPILAIPIETWNTWYPQDNPESGQHPFAAPIPATERGRNTQYVFATAPRYNFSYLLGWEEVDEIVKTLKAQ